MSWKEIGKAINDTLFGGKIKPLNRIVEDEAYDNFYNFMAAFSNMQYQGQMFEDDVWRIVPYGIVDLTSDIVGPDSVDSVILPNTVKTIKKGAFPSNTLYVCLPPSLRTIETEAFAYCNSLYNIILPNRLESIGQYAFRGCTSLKVIVIPHSVKSIGSASFSACTNLRDIYVPWAEDEIPGAPWGATNATIHYETGV